MMQPMKQVFSKVLQELDIVKVALPRLAVLSSLPALDQEGLEELDQTGSALDGLHLVFCPQAPGLKPMVIDSVRSGLNFVIFFSKMRFAL